MTLDSLAFLVLVASLSIVSSIIVHEIRVFFGYRRLILVFGHLLLLIPWLGHFNKFLSMANSDAMPLQVYLAPLSILLLIFFFVQIESQIVRFANALVPFFAFIITRYYVMPTVYEANQDYKFDNIPTIWLFFWSFIATSMILTYVLPARIFMSQEYKD